MARFDRLAALLPPLPPTETVPVAATTPVIAASPAVPPAPYTHEQPTILAWRAWKVTGRRLGSVARPDIWSPLLVNEAKCARGLHKAPALNCMCGYYGMRRLEDLLAQTDYCEDSHMIGLVYLWGKTAPHDDGFRSRYCAVAALLHTWSVPVLHDLSPGRVRQFEKRDRELALAYEVPLLEAR